MKRIQRLSVIPPDYQAAVVAYQRERPRETWDWNHFRDEHRDAVKGLKEALLQRQHGLCAYCENRLAPSFDSKLPGAPQDDLRQPKDDLRQFQIEHVLPKSNYPERHLDSANMVAACMGGTQAAQERLPGGVELYRPATRDEPGKAHHCCGQTKLDSDALDPRELPSRLRIFRISEGTGELKLDRERCAGHLSEERMAEIERCVEDVLKLNCPRLREARRKRLEHYSLLMPDIPEDATAAQMDAFLRDRLAADERGRLREFWTTHRYVLGQKGEAWLTSHPDEDPS